MKINNFNSVKIKVMSFISIIFVIYIHSPYTEAAGHPMALAVQRFMTDFGMAIFAVPLFFAISGMLFFNGIQRCSECFPKIKKRVFTLLIPYLIWNVVFVGWYAMMSMIPGVSQFVNSNIIGKLMSDTPLNIINFLFVEPAAFHLWFLRDLMLYVLMSPLLYICIKRFPWVLFCILLVCFGWMPRFGATYFVLGGIVSIHYSLDKVSSFLNKKVVVALMTLFFINAVAALLGFINPGNIYYQYYVQFMGIIAILAVWGCYDILVGNQIKTPVWCSKILSFTFFIYLFHEPAFNIIKKLGLKLIGINDWSLIGLFIVNPFIMVAFAVGVGIIFKRILPRVYSVCVGGR